MKNENTDVQAVEKLKRIIMGRYGKGLMLRQLVDLNKADKLNEHQLKGVDLYIPLRLNEEYLGTAIVPFADDLAEDKRSQISQLVKMAMEPVLYSDFLERKQNNLQQITDFEFSTENLEVFEDGTAAPSSDDEMTDEEMEAGDGSQLLTQIIHLSSENENALRKMAHQIHEMTHRWAFVPFQDIASQIHGVSDLVKLGAMTILVTDIEKLDQSLQSILVEYISEERSDQEPLIISTSGLKASEIEKHENLLPLLRDEITINTFDVDRAPFSYSQLKEVIELFFFRQT